MIRAFLLASLVLAGCSAPPADPAHPLDVIRYPGAIAASADGRYLYVAGTNFDLRYRGGVVQVLDLAALEARVDAATTTPVLIDDPPFTAGVEVGSFAGLIALASIDGDKERLFVPCRADGTVAVIDADAAGGLTCVVPTGTDPATVGDNCAPHQIVLEAEAAGTIVDPFSVAVVGGHAFIGALRHQRIDLNDATSPVTTFMARLSVAAPEQVHVIRRGSMHLRDLVASPSGTLFGAGYSGRIAQGDPGSAEVESLDPATFTGTVDRRAYNLRGVLGALDARSLLFSTAGDRVYVLTRSPSALVILEVSETDPTDAGQLSLLGAVALPESPSRMALVPRPDGELVALTATGADALLVVDPRRAEVVGLLDGLSCDPAAPCPNGSREPEERASEADVGLQPWSLVVRPRAAGGVRVWLSSFGDGALPTGNGTIRAVDIPDLARPGRLHVSAVVRAPDPEDAP